MKCRGIFCFQEGVFPIGPRFLYNQKALHCRSVLSLPGSYNTRIFYQIFFKSENNSKAILFNSKINNIDSNTINLFLLPIFAPLKAEKNEPLKKVATAY